MKDTAAMLKDDRFSRLARQIDSSRRTGELADPERIARLRREGAVGLHRICAEFVQSVNEPLGEPLLELAPSTFVPEYYRESAVNLIQIASQGRELQIAFGGPAQLVSTDKFLVPYVLEGEVRTYNQRMLEHFEVRTRAIFYCVEEGGAAGWRFFDWRTRATGPLTRDVLAGLMEPLF
jgi:hypothetical protein